MHVYLLTAKLLPCTHLKLPQKIKIRGHSGIDEPRIPRHAMDAKGEKRGKVSAIVGTLHYLRCSNRIKTGKETGIRCVSCEDPRRRMPLTWPPLG